ncbi:hypothetical protein DPEC_G00311920 [Dallia pectoralis]|uniref:Uncharacterized protein n=1 Tax=Dallia pectoralis TaxID=75939 RepID=A0ACC2FBN6_DALPE|nr:hypothetical protein DPEC_G00311920 [Dallia pectoralis]
MTSFQMYCRLKEHLERENSETLLSKSFNLNMAQTRPWRRSVHVLGVRAVISGESLLSKVIIQVKNSVTPHPHLLRPGNKPPLTAWQTIDKTSDIHGRTSASTHTSGRLLRRESDRLVRGKKRHSYNRAKMLSPMWLLAVTVVGVFGGVTGQCWEKPQCQDLSSESNILECIELCRSDLSAEYPVFPGEMHLQPVSDFDSPAPSSALSPLSASSPLSPLSPSSVASTLEQQNGVQNKRSYSMEHFRWGKPVGRKRRPVKVYTNGVEEESSEAFPSEMRRALDAGATEGGESQGLGGEANNPGRVSSLQEKKDGSYKMKHFRWSGPPASKRYGGFMKSWDEHSQKPLLTLFRNVIIKDRQ